MGIHETAIAGFGRGAPAYERGRPSYPQDAVDWMLERLAIGPTSAVADLGAGTGKLTRMLLSSGARVIAVEPSPGMREELHRAVPAATIIEATAEAIPLPAGDLDAVTAAQSFHWFASERALAEIHRVLRQRGGLGLIWNRRDMADPLQVALEAVIAQHRGEAPAHEGNRWMDVMERTRLFEPVGQRAFSYVQRLDRAGLTDRVLSISFIAALSDAERKGVARQVESVAGAATGFQLAYRTDAYLYRGI